MFLYNCILIGASVFSMCYTESTSNHATSSQSYDRGDVSLSYKYSLVHIYTTSKPQNYSNNNSKNKYQNKDPHQKLRRLVNYQNFQYAPLPLRTQEQHSTQVFNQLQELEKAKFQTKVNTSVYNNRNIEEIDSLKEQKEKNNLVPRMTPIEPSNAHPRKYIPGYNVNLQALKNKLMQNGLYASNPNFLVKNKQVNVNYLQPQTTYKEQEQNLRGIHQNSEAKAKGGYSKKYNGNVLAEDVHIANPPFFYVKAPKVDLNLARGHHIAHPQHKASVNVNSSFRKLPSLPQEFFSNPKNFKFSNTQLYPVPNSKVYIVHHTA